MTSPWIPPPPPSPPWGRSSLWGIVASVEVALVVTTVILDLFIPSLILLMLAACSLVLRRQGPRSLGVLRPSPSSRMIAQVVALTLAWNVVMFLAVVPLLEFTTGTRRDVGGFAALQGDLALLLFLLALTWTLAAVGEEFAFRGYLQTRMRELLPGPLGFAVAILLSSVLFGWVHTEQGVVGVIVTTVDGIFFSVLRYRFRTLWASVVSHGVSNTAGIMVFFLFGPVHAPW